MKGRAARGQRGYRGLDAAVALRDEGRLAPVNGRMVDEIEARLARVGAQPAR